MYRTASSRLRAIKARTGCRGLARYASTSASAIKSSSLPPLDVPLESIVLPPPLPDSVELGKTKITTLPNGLRIASETSASSAASIGLYVDAGSIYESPASYGATHLLERMAFKTTFNRSHLRVVREVEAIGGNITASSSRERMSYTFGALKTYVPQMVELLVDCVRNQALLDWEVNEQLLKMRAEISECSKNPHHLLLEAIHSTGYSGAYANSLLASEAAVSRLNSNVLENFVSEHYTAPRIVLAASGVEHEKLLEYAEPLLSDMPKDSKSVPAKPTYTGGDFRRQGDSGLTHFAMAFELPGGWTKEKDAMTLTVLKMLMGGGRSFSAGSPFSASGPGKAVYLTSGLGPLKEHPQIRSSSAFSSIYNHTGLFGIQATAETKSAPEAMDIVCRELLAVTSPGDVDKLKLTRAKQATKSAILMNLESRVNASEDIGKQILTYGERKPVEQYLNAVDQITANDIVTVAKKLFSSPLTLACYGDVHHLPCYDAVSKRFSRI
ncbi:mitochondrial-processing peptidase subunit alpha-like isoform X1 [Salvia hispanica]|uniref:mitochondrial-processing peptidase subunit alpha-like isoform X1 n=1 Tax=Salvia hispanica TaxID=49212 RepID=UPI0020092BAB|nr:mitochondrial-processing peptidase subunit alpha-like isoform X1 [Salvia hispanica]